MTTNFEKIRNNNENAVRDKYIQKLENKMSDLQCKFYENSKKVVDAQKQIDKYLGCLQEIKAIAEKCDLCDDCTGIDDCERYCGDSAEPCATRQMNNILEIINKAEEE